MWKQGFITCANRFLVDPRLRESLTVAYPSPQQVDSLILRP
jgi:hypothetical protein